MKKKTKDKYYRDNLKSKMAITIGIAIVGVLFVYIMLFVMKKEADFMKTAKLTTAEIVDVKYKSAQNEAGKLKYQRIDIEDAKYIVIKYYVDNVEYTKQSKTMDASMYIGKTIDVYYNEENPEEFVIQNLGGMAIIIVVCAILVVVGIVGSIIEFKNVIRYIQTLNGVEIKAEIIRVIPVKKWWYMNYKIECKGKDESGALRTFYSRNFNEPYLEKEIEKLKSKTLTVRYKKHHPEKYIVLTEQLEKRLSV